MCFYLKAYNDNNKCDWDGTDATTIATSLKQGSIWSADYTKDSVSNCITWLECPEYETPTTAGVVIDVDLTNWFELWVKWNLPDQTGGADISYYEIIYYKDGDKWADGVDVACSQYDDPNEFTDVRKKENKLHKLTSTTQKIGIPGLIMDKDYSFCVRACNGINKCNEYCKLSDKETVTYKSPQLPKIP